MDLLDENKDETAPEISDETSDGDAFSESSQSLRYKTNERILPARFTTGSESGHTLSLNNTFTTYQYLWGLDSNLSNLPLPSLPLSMLIPQVFSMFLY